MSGVWQATPTPGPRPPKEDSGTHLTSLSQRTTTVVRETLKTTKESVNCWGAVARLPLKGGAVFRCQRVSRQKRDEKVTC